MDNKREHKRTPLKVQLRIDHPAHGQMLVTTRDISESGVFVVIDDAQKLLQIGELVSGQVQGLPIEAIVKALMGLLGELERLLPELSGLAPVADKIESMGGDIGVVRLQQADVVRHPLVAKMLNVL